MAVKTPAPERAAGRRALASKGLALPDGSFPVKNASYWDKARKAIGRVKSPAKRAAVAKLLRKTAPRFGKTAALKQSWAAPGGSSHSNIGTAIELVGPKGYVHGWIYEGAPGRKGEIIDHLPTADKMTKTQLQQHLNSHHAGTPIPAGARRVGPRNPSKAQLLAMHEAHHGVNRPKGSLFAMPFAHTHGAERVAAAKKAGLYGSAGVRTLGEQAGERRVAAAKRAGLYGASGVRTIQSSNLSPALEFAMPTHQPIRDPAELLIVRGGDGRSAIIRHRAGGDEIGTIRKDGTGWRASVRGKDLQLRNHQRTALADVIGTHNRGALTPQHRPADSAGAALQPPPQQTPLMASYGIPAVRSFATPTTSASSGPRMTSQSDSDSDDSSSGGGLNAKGQQIYKKLKARGFPDARAMAFARRAQNFGGSK